MTEKTEPIIKTFPEMKFTGNRANMSFSNDKTEALWKGFMPNRGGISNIRPELYSIGVYPSSFFHNFNPNAEFVKWAAMEVKDFDDTPDGMGSISIHGLYAVFLYVGAANEG